MNRFRPYILALSILCAGLLAYGFLTLPKPRPADYDGFSSARVIEDIQVISREHHSVAHPQERAKVREYLAGRLEEMGGKVILGSDCHNRDFLNHGFDMAIEYIKSMGFKTIARLGGFGEPLFVEDEL